jgi:Glycosyl hydrolase family 99
MGRRFGLIAILGAVLGLSSPFSSAQDVRARPSRHLILAHYMPWFESKPISGRWGWHWTMSHFDPDRSNSSGRRDIASHFYPLIGPYDSADPDVLDYHALLMKIAGIDGVIADWYGSEDFNDYAAIHRRTGLLFDTLGRRGLKFAVCYEDRVLKAMTERGKWTTEQAVEHARTHLRFCEENWFSRPQYATWDGKPLLLVFGPDFLGPSQWDVALSEIRPTPMFFTLHERKSPAIGSFSWPPMWASKDGELDAKELDAYLDRFSRQEGLKIGSAFPGFRDIYKEAGAQPSHGHLDARDGETFRHTLGRSTTSKCPVIQVATWNDFGEGTCIEPTREYGYRYLEAVQDARRRFADDPFPFRPDDLRLPLRVHHLRKRFAPSSPERKILDEAEALLFAADIPRASQKLDALEGAASPPSSRAK